MGRVLCGCAVLSVGVVVLIVGFVVGASLPGWREIGVGRFFGDGSWHPAAEAGRGTFDLTPMVVGTLAVTAGALVLAVPMGIGSALFCEFYAPPVVGGVYRRLVELLAGIPSVVYGFWGLVVLVPLIGRVRPPGSSLLAAVLVLSVMVLPTIAAVSGSALAAVPGEYVRGAAALGLSRWATVRGVVMPAARSGLWAAVILGVGRAIGETMAVLLICGNVVQVPGSVFDPVRTLTTNIALEMAYAMGAHRSALFVSGVVLMGMVVVLVGVAGLVGGRGRAYV